MTFENKLKFAERVATFMHMGQVDKAGEPYIDHVRRVASAVETYYPNDEVARIAAWLHDTAEDTSLTLTAIRAEFGKDVAEAVKALSRNFHSNDTEYYTAIARNSSALNVKVEDIADNGNPERLSKLPPSTQNRLLEKYQNAMDMLSQAIGMEFDDNTTG